MLLIGLVASVVCLPLDELEGMKSRVAAIGDVDGKGATDVAIASRVGLVGLNSAGKIPSASGISTKRHEQLVWVVSIETGDLISVIKGDGGPGFASVLGRAGDIDRDGREDVVIGNGRAIGDVLSARRSSLSVYSIDTGTFIARREFGELQLGRAAPFAAAGDVNADGYDDIVVAYPDESRVETLSGGDLSTVGAFARKKGLLFGHAMEVVGDVDGDGASEVLVASLGALELVSLNDNEVLLRMEADGPESDPISPGNLLWLCGEVGDWDGDSVVDYYGVSINNWVRIWSGKDGSTLRQVDWTGGDVAGEGASCAGVWSQDGSNVPRLFIGANESYLGLYSPGSVWVLSDAAYHRVLDADYESPDGFDICAIGDVNGDKEGDLAVVSRVTNMLTVYSGRDMSPIHVWDLASLPVEK